MFCVLRKEHLALALGALVFFVLFIFILWRGAAQPALETSMFLAEDGSLFVYLSDGDSENVEDTAASWAVRSGSGYTDQGAILLDETGRFHRIVAPEGRVRNSVGAGDSMVAGFLAGWLQTGDYGQALRLGTAAGSATAFSDGLATRAAVEALLSRM